MWCLFVLWLTVELCLCASFFFCFSVCLLLFVLCRGWRVVVGVESCSGGHCDVVGVVLRALAYEMGKCGNSLLLSSTVRPWCGGCGNPILFYFWF
jgi:hypothetical protein